METNNSDIKVSVILPVYNSEKTLQKCIESVLLQNFQYEFELLIGYNPSNDKTLEIIKDYERKDRKVRIINLPGCGASLSRMETLKHAKGEYIAFIDADDMYEPFFLCVMYAKALEGFDVVNCSFKTIKHNRQKKSVFAKDIELTNIEACEALMDDSYMRSFVWNKLIKRDLLSLKGMPIMKDRKPLFEDFPMLFFILKNANRVASIKLPLYLYNKDSNGITTIPNPERLLFHIKSYAMVKAMCDSEELLNAFVSKKNRAKASFYFDALVSRKATKKSASKLLKEYKEDINILFTPSEKYSNKQEIIDYVNESFK